VSDLPGGVVAPLATPLTEMETLDVPALRQLVQHQVQAGADALFILGSCGEGPLLLEDMSIQVIRTAVETAAGAAPVYAGASDNSVVRVLDRIGRLADEGAAAAVLTLPYYAWNGDQDCATEFFVRTADRSPLPIIAYNLPRVTGSSLTLATVKVLAKHPNVIALKDTRDDYERMRAVAACPERQGRLSHLIGNSSLAGRLMRDGADGIVSTLGNCYPHLVEQLWQSHLRGEEEMVEKCTKILTDLSPIMSLPTTPGGIKCALELRGLGRAVTVRPWPMPKPVHRLKIRELMRKADAALAELGIPAWDPECSQATAG